MIGRYYTSASQLALSQARGRAVVWLECDECEGAGYWIPTIEGDPRRQGEDDTENPELCESCVGRGGDWGMQLPPVVLSCNCGQCSWCEAAITRMISRVEQGLVDGGLPRKWSRIAVGRER